MRVYLGECGLDQSWQDDFKKTTKCVHCGKKARIGFVAMEGGTEVRKEKCVCELHETTGEKGGLWLHDVMACATYLCPFCFGATSIINQA